MRYVTVQIIFHLDDCLNRYFDLFFRYILEHFFHDLLTCVIVFLTEFHAGIR